MKEIKLCECGCGGITEKVKHTINEKGIKKGEYNRFISYHHLKGKPKSLLQRKKMSKTRKEWYIKNPEKAKDKASNMQITKILKGNFSGEKNPNYGSGKFTGVSYKGPSWWKIKNEEGLQNYKQIFSIINKNENNPNWKGDDVGKAALHGWIKKNKPKPELCVNCKKVAPYDLANISQKYVRNINDFKWLCRKCHMLEDGRLEKLHINGKSNQ